jgi:amidase
MGAPRLGCLESIVETLRRTGGFSRFPTGIPGASRTHSAPESTPAAVSHRAAQESAGPQASSSKMKNESPSSQALSTSAIRSAHEFHGSDAPPDDVGAFVPGMRVERPATGSGVLDGLSCGVKDVFDIAGCPTGYGNPDWERTHDIPLVDAVAVSMLRQHGAHIVGKTLTDELAFSLAGNNHHYGAPINSAAPDRLTGGSSCGSAAAVAAGLCDIGLGTDTAGSVRAPASFCGVFGFRSTHGTISTDGVCRLAHSFDSVGWLARDAHTLAAVGRALLPDAPMLRDPASWICFESAWRHLKGAKKEEVESLLNDVAPTLGDRSVFSLDIAELDHCVDAFRTIQFYQVWSELGPWVKQVQPVLGPDVLERMLAASKVTKDEYLAAGKIQRNTKARFDSLLESGRVLVMPTVSGFAPMRDSSVAELNNQRRADLRFLCIASLAGLPQVSLPALTAVSHAPLGLSLIGSAGMDGPLLALATKLAAGGSIGSPVAQRVSVR